MNSLTKTKVIVFVLLILLILTTIILVVITNNNSHKNNNSKQTNVLPTGAGPAKSNSYDQTPQQTILQQQQTLVSQLIEKVPYAGLSFSLDYDFNDAKFILTLNSNNLVQANTEFDSFLKQNGIQSRSWFTNLETYTKPFTPAP